MAGGPAEKAGVRAGDVIATISGTPTKGLSLYEASDLLQVGALLGCECGVTHLYRCRCRCLSACSYLWSEHHKQFGMLDGCG